MLPAITASPRPRCFHMQASIPRFGISDRIKKSPQTLRLRANPIQEELEETGAMVSSHRHAVCFLSVIADISPRNIRQRGSGIKHQTVRNDGVNAAAPGFQPQCMDWA
ncbi:hypothetical protein [Noviherbaspirillum sp. Root189]|uniref:hypothetical protein n=1 Tax=Noviherbaspirillum sp. Root189 TaxID=1736487 RepID=UPI000715C368|nr:hypothetical protein [Noviherbaspirillum sp. Root189]KRB87426.1 hypothetical protein ASE07_20150 [Noviherbaspirillum sp. Root189]